MENKLLALHKKKLEMQQQLRQAELKNTQLELKFLQEQPETSSLWEKINWPLWLGLAGLVVLLSWKGGKDD